MSREKSKDVRAYLFSKETPYKPTIARSVLVVEYLAQENDLFGLLYAGSERQYTNVWPKGYLRNNMTKLMECRYEGKE